MAHALFANARGIPYHLESFIDKTTGRNNVADFNPYQAPRAHVEDISAIEDTELAGRWARLGAALLDTVILALFFLLPFYLLGWWSSLTKPFLGLVLGQVAYLIFNGYFLFTRGQTIGKKLLGIKIALTTGEHPGIGRSYGLRYLLPGAIVQIHPLLSMLAILDVLFIFGQSRRCAHDLIAGTIVVKA